MMIQTTYHIHASIAVSNVGVALLKQSKSLSALRAFQNALNIIQGCASNDDIDRCLADSMKALESTMREHKPIASFDVFSIQHSELNTAVAFRFSNPSVRRLYALQVNGVPNDETNPVFYNTVILHNLGLCYLSLADSCDNLSQFATSLIGGARDALRSAQASASLTSADVVLSERASNQLKALSILISFSSEDLALMLGLKDEAAQHQQNYQVDLKDFFFRLADERSSQYLPIPTMHV